MSSEKKQNIARYIVNTGQSLSQGLETILGETLNINIEDFQKGAAAISKFTAFKYVRPDQLSSVSNYSGPVQESNKLNDLITRRIDNANKTSLIGKGHINLFRDNYMVGADFRTKNLNNESINEKAHNFAGDQSEIMGFSIYIPYVVSSGNDFFVLNSLTKEIEPCSYEDGSDPIFIMELVSKACNKLQEEELEDILVGSEDLKTILEKIEERLFEIIAESNAGQGYRPIYSAAECFALVASDDDYPQFEQREIVILSNTPVISSDVLNVQLKVERTDEEIEATQILYKYIDFFSAPFIEGPQFQAWAATHADDSNLRSLSDCIKEIVQKEPSFVRSLVGEMDDGQRCLLAGDASMVSVILGRNPDWVKKLTAHQNNPIIKLWYEENNKLELIESRDVEGLKYSSVVKERDKAPEAQMDATKEMYRLAQKAGFNAFRFFYQALEKEMQYYDDSTLTDEVESLKQVFKEFCEGKSNEEIKAYFCQSIGLNAAQADAILAYDNAGLTQQTFVKAMKIKILLDKSKVGETIDKGKIDKAIDCLSANKPFSAGGFMRANADYFLGVDVSGVFSEKEKAQLQIMSDIICLEQEMKAVKNIIDIVPKDHLAIVSEKTPAELKEVASRTIEHTKEAYTTLEDKLPGYLKKSEGYSMVINKGMGSVVGMVVTDYCNATNTLYSQLETIRDCLRESLLNPNATVSYLKETHRNQTAQVSKAYRSTMDTLGIRSPSPLVGLEKLIKKIVDKLNRIFGKSLSQEERTAEKSLKTRNNTVQNRYNFWSEEAEKCEQEEAAEQKPGFSQQSS